MDLQFISSINLKDITKYNLGICYSPIQKKILSNSFTKRILKAPSRKW